MWDPDDALAALAQANRNIFNRPMAYAFGLSDKHLRVRLARRQIHRLHRGTFCAGPPVLDWHQRLLAATTAAAGVDARVSHRAALLVQGLDGIGAAPLEIKVLHSTKAAMDGVIVHRSRRNEVFEVRHGVKVTSLNQTLLDVASCCPPIVVEKALESAIRQRRISTTSFEEYLDLVGTKGCTGAKVIRTMLAERLPGAAGSGAEVEFAAILRQLRALGFEDPIRQLVVNLPDGTKATTDAAWPMRMKIVEIDGRPDHEGMRDADYDSWREVLLREAGWDVIRFSASRIRRDPEGVLRALIRFLGA